MDENHEEDCTIYIEELKSDDPNLKINAVSKVCNIAEILGPARVRLELVPYLIEIIEEQDNEDEFLIKLAHEILTLKDFVGGKDKQHVLIAPLEILSSMEESLVREKAVSCLISLTEGQHKSFFENHFFQIVQQLGQWDNFPSRISACSLLPVIYPNLTDEKQQMLWQLFIQLCQDDTPMVRRTCATIIPQMASVDSVKISDMNKNVLLEQWQNLLRDKIDSVKIRAVEATPQMLKLMLGQKSLIEEQIRAFFALASKSERSWRVRYTVPELFPQIVKFIDKEILKTQAVPILENLLKDPEPEVRSIAIQNAYYLLQELPNSISLTFIPHITALASDQSIHVRFSLSEQLCKLASLFNQDVVAQHIIPIITLLFKDEVQDVKMKLAHSLPQISQALGPEQSKKHILPFILNFQNEKQWRVRLEIVTMIPKFVKVAGYETYQELQETIFNQAILNHYYAIREQALENFSAIKDIFGYDRVRNNMKEAVVGLANQNNYIFRVSSLHSLIKLKSILSVTDLNQLFEEIYLKLLDDLVPNVRFNVFKTFTAIQDKLDQKTKNDFIKKSKKCQNDQDIDVAYFASNFQNLSI